jgi:hypothetical protein
MDTTDREIPWLWLALMAAGLVAAVVGGEDDARLVGAMSVLIFGALALISFAPRVRRTRGLRIVDGGFFLPMSRARVALVLVAALALMVGGVLLAVSGESFWGSAVALIFAGGSYNGFRSLVVPNGLTLTPTGIVVVYNRRAEIAWDDIKRVHLFSEGSVRNLGIDARHIRRPEGNWWTRLNRRLEMADVVLPISYCAADPDRIADLLMAYRTDPRRRAAIGTQAELARVL